MNGRDLVVLGAALSMATLGIWLTTRKPAKPAPPGAIRPGDPLAAEVSFAHLGPSEWLWASWGLTSAIPWWQGWWRHNPEEVKWLAKRQQLMLPLDSVYASYAVGDDLVQPRRYTYTLETRFPSGIPWEGMDSIIRLEGKDMDAYTIRLEGWFDDTFTQAR